MSLASLPGALVHRHIWRQLSQADRGTFKLLNTENRQLIDECIESVEVTVQRLDSHSDGEDDDDDSTRHLTAQHGRFPHLASLTLKEWEDSERLLSALLKLGSGTVARLRLLSGDALGFDSTSVSQACPLLQAFTFEPRREVLLPLRFFAAWIEASTLTEVTLGEHLTLPADAAAGLSALPSLTHLALRGDLSRVADLTPLLTLTRLTHLALASPTNQQLASAEPHRTAGGAMCAMRALQVLHLEGLGVDDATLAALQQLPALLELCVGSIQPSDPVPTTAAAAAVAGAAAAGGGGRCLHTLRRLCVGGEIEATALRSTLEALLPLPSLVHLYQEQDAPAHLNVFVGGPADVAALRAVGAHLARQPHAPVTSLCVIPCGELGDFAPVARSLATWERLESLSVDDFSLSSVDWPASLRGGLTSLLLRSCGVTRAGLRGILTSLGRLQRLSLLECDPLNDEAWVELLGVRPFTFVGADVAGEGGQLGIWVVEDSRPAGAGGEGELEGDGTDDGDASEGDEVEEGWDGGEEEVEEGWEGGQEDEEEEDGDVGEEEAAAGERKEDGDGEEGVDACEEQPQGYEGVDEELEDGEMDEGEEEDEEVEDVEI